MFISLSLSLSLCLSLSSVSEESLEDYLSLHERIDEPLAAKYILKIMEGLQYLHDSKIIHTNLSVSKQTKNSVTTGLMYGTCSYHTTTSTVHVL